MKLQKQVHEALIETILGKHLIVLHGDNEEFDLKLGDQGIEMITYPGVKKVWGVSDVEIRAAEQYILKVLNESQGESFSVLELETEESWKEQLKNK